MLFEVESSKDLNAIDSALRDAAARHKFGVLGVIDLKQKMQEKGLDFSSETRIYEVCNPQQAKRVLEANGAVSTALPCRISVYGKEGAYRIATILPSAMMQIFETPGMDTVAKEVETEIVAIMKESA